MLHIETSFLLYVGASARNYSVARLFNFVVQDSFKNTGRYQIEDTVLFLYVIKFLLHLCLLHIVNTLHNSVIVVFIVDFVQLFCAVHQLLCDVAADLILTFSAVATGVKNFHVLYSITTLKLLNRLLLNRLQVSHRNLLYCLQLFPLKHTNISMYNKLL